MKLLKPLLASALLALPAAPMTVRAEDTDAQKQAIEALRRIQSPRSTAPAAKAPAAPAKPAPAPAPAAKPVEMKKAGPAVVSAPVANPAYVPPSDTAAQQQALEVLRAKQASKPAPVVVSTPKPMAQPSPKPAPAPAVKPVEMKKAAPMVVSAPVANPAYVPPSDTAAQQQALGVLRMKQAAKPAPAMVSAPKPPAPKPATTVAAPKPVAKPAAPTQVSKAAPAPIPAMAPTTKEGKLAELTRRYLNDEVTPREYHTQRAKILAD